MRRIGVIGPPPSIDRIFEVANEFEHDIEFIPFPYEEARDAKRIVMENNQKVNGWFFSGPIPYVMAKNVLDSSIDYVYSPNTGSSLYKCLLQLHYEVGHALDGISIDMIETEDVQRDLDELGVSVGDVFIKTFNHDYLPQELIDFHLERYEAGSTSGVLTCLDSVYTSLKEKGVPVIRILITKMEIKQALTIILEKVKSSYFKDSQVGVEIIEIQEYERIAEKVNTRVQLQQVELKIKQTLLELCEKLDGSFLEIGTGRYQIFSSRGAIEREILVLGQTINRLKLEAGVPAIVGIGYGETAASAENNAYKAIQHLREHKDHEISIVQEDGVFTESVGNEDELTYSYRTEDKDLLDRIHQANISIKTYRKMEAVVQRMGWNGFTTADIATHLSMTKRNAQRIVASLCEVGLVEYKGEQSHITRGRASKIYQLTQ
ncbi:hypothetical protein [Bacillus coreaensis]